MTSTIKYIIGILLVWGCCSAASAQQYTMRYIHQKADSVIRANVGERIAHINFEKLDYQQSVGHKIYLHLGGEDNIDNLEVVDTSVLWELQVQISRRINVPSKE